MIVEFFLESSIAEEKAVKQQLDQTQQRFDVGLVAITDVHESRAVYDLARVTRLTNEGVLETSYEGLTVLTGRMYRHLQHYLFQHQARQNAQPG